MLAKSASIFLPALALCLSLSAGVAAQAQPAPSRVSADEVAKAVKSLVEREFYKQVTFPTLTGEAAAAGGIARALADLGTSHTMRVEPGSLDYYELVDILRGGSRDARRIFPPNGEPTYAGIGIATRQVDGRTFVSDVYDGAAASSAGVMVGDELLRVDGEPYKDLDSFEGKAGRTATLTVRRMADATPIEIKTQVGTIRPTRTFYTAIEKSMRVVEEDGLKIAYLRLWALGSGDIENMITRELKQGRLKDADGLVIDLRGRWGGRFAEVPDLLFSRETEVTFKGRDGRTSYSSATYDKPVVAIIDEGSRSSQEMFAELMRKRGITLVGKKTSGAVLAAGSYFLPDKSLLVLPVSEVRIDGELLEGKGVAPDREVDFWLPYAAGKDAQLEKAMDTMAQKLCADAARAVLPACSNGEIRAN